MLKAIIGVAIGGALGFGIGTLARCTTGTCPLTSNPWSLTLLGAVFGLFVGLGK